MKNLLIILLSTSLFFLACKSKNDKNTVSSSDTSSEILFEVRTTDEEYLEIFEDGIIPWISIKDPKPEIDHLIGKNEIVINKTNVILYIDYPLENAVEINLTSNNPMGFTRKELAQKISIEYNRIYEEEEEDSANTKTTPLEERQGLINRNKTDGKYGIWGHDIDDLDLSAIILSKMPNGELKLELIVES